MEHLLLVGKADDVFSLQRGRAFGAVFCLVIVLSFLPAQADQAPVTDDTFTDMPTSSLIYVSDYVSFVGQDGQGHVAFALDNNRGRDGDDYQAEHFLVLHDEKIGWVGLNGNGWYDNTDSMKDLKVEVLDRELAWGFYRWPTAWRISWTGSQGPVVLPLKQLTKASVDNWAIGGFSMTVVRGDLRSAGKQQEVYGLVELIM